MKKISLFFVCLFTILITGCSNDDFSERGSSNTKRSKTAHWYGVKQLQDSVSLRSAADRMKLWAQDPVITVKFLNSTDDPAMLDQIKTYAKEWEQYAGITFQFVESSENALVRIGFDWNDNSWLTWSYTGNDAKMVRSQSEPTACFGGFNDGVMSDEEIKGDVLRVFGQILGLEFEQRHQGWDPSWWKKDKNGVYYAEKYWDGMFDGYYENLDWETIRQFVFDPLAGATVVQTADVDFESIMMWPYYTKKEAVKLYANYELSEGDKEFIATLYPKKEGNTIQTAWVDAGYFEWANEEKTQLKITEKGAQMEYLPDVVDGEQLTSAKAMFTTSDGRAISLIKKAPIFNTSNVTDFSSMFSFCKELKEIPYYETSRGVSFACMFDRCENLEEIPLLNTSNGTNFISMFNECYKLKSVPLFDTSKGVYFHYMFLRCYELEEIPLLNTSQAISLQSMFYGCSKLKTVPCLDTSNATDLSGLFWLCKSLISVPQLNTSKCRHFGYMFSNCSSLTSIPLIDTSQGELLYYMFFNCSSLESLPLLDLSNARNLNYMFGYCVNLKKVPHLNVPNAFSFNEMFSGTDVLEYFEMSGFGETNVWDSKSYKGDKDLNISSPVLEVRSLQYLVDNTTGAIFARIIYLNKALQSKVSPELIAQAAAKNIKFEFIY